MMMQDDTEKHAIRNLMQIVEEPSLRPDFESQMTAAWLEKSLKNQTSEAFPRQVQALTLTAQQWVWVLGLFLFMMVGFAYLHHLRELEEMRKFDLLLDFSMGTL